MLGRKESFKMEEEEGRCFIVVGHVRYCTVSFHWNKLHWHNNASGVNEQCQTEVSGPSRTSAESMVGRLPDLVGRWWLGHLDCQPPFLLFVHCN